MKFSIRDLIFLTVIVALATGWWVDRRSLADKVAQWEHRFMAFPGMPEGAKGPPEYFWKRILKESEIPDSFSPASSQPASNRWKKAGP